MTESATSFASSAAAERAPLRLSQAVREVVSLHADTKWDAGSRKEERGGGASVEPFRR